ncbi:hypothetical protein ACFSMW_14750 [Virgibacillus halophilus]|uniref:Helix-turn-helix domain-containing protein n=1 Tax=Tigheibacillus halophilus TaxID=361280 RepID=A0ABU5CE57_9BACI|nr:hypothetical protein [Virgibacillus halophilus]
MNTLTYLPTSLTSNFEDNIILMEDVEFTMSKEQLKQITMLHNEGWHFKKIANEVKRDPFEVIIALLHQVRHRKEMRPFAWVEK